MIGKTNVASGGSSPTPPTPVENPVEKDINFYDYDGTLVDSWTLDELATATALPANPSHEGLTAQGWNWTLANLKSENIPMNVGQMYITDDGKTRLCIEIPEGITNAADKKMEFAFISDRAGGLDRYYITVDWGDGTIEEVDVTSTTVSFSHSYTSSGEYKITLKESEGLILHYGGLSSKNICGDNLTTSATYASWALFVKGIELGDIYDVLGIGAFRGMRNLEYITIPNHIDVVSNITFRECSSLKFVCIPNSVNRFEFRAFYDCYSLQAAALPNTLAGNSATNFQEMFYNCCALKKATFSNNYASMMSKNNIFSGCYKLKSFLIPESTVSIGTGAFRYSYGLNRITIPSSVTTLSTYAFADSNLLEIHMKPTTPPTLSSTYVFNKIPVNCVIYVPQGCLEAYQNATNWTTYAEYMQEEPA